MKLFSYIRYFGYLAFNWNLKIAVHILAKDISGEKKYGIHTTGADELKDLEKKGIDISHATIYMPVSYPLLEKAFGQLPGSPRTHFLDIGCGKGRALCVAAHHGFNKLTGVDLSKELCKIAKENLRLTSEKYPALEYHVFNNDAFYFEIPADVNTIFLFNPFDEVIMSGVVENIQQSLEESPRLLTVIYVNPLHKELFARAGFKETFHFKQLKYLELSILRN